MEIQQLKEISARVYSNVQSLTQADIDVLKRILELKDIKYGRIGTYSLEDSKVIILAAIKQNCVILLKFLLESKIALPGNLLDAAIKLITESTENTHGLNSAMKHQSQYDYHHSHLSCSDPHALLEKERITRQIYNCIIDILYISRYSNEDLKRYLSEKTLPDDVSINLVPIVDCKYKSFEMSVLHDMTIGPVLLSVISAHHNVLRKRVKAHIISGIKATLRDDSSNSIQFQIFYLINEDEHLDVLRRVKVEHTPEYVGFVHSLIRSGESANIAFDKLKPLFDDFETAVSVILSYAGPEERRIQPKDEKMLFHILECIVRLLKYKGVMFYRFVQAAQRLLRLSVGPRIKGLLYEFLSFFAADADTYIERIISCRAEIDEEQKTKRYFLLPRLIAFLNVYRKRIALEAEYNDNQQVFSAEEDLDRTELECRMAGLKSEDPQTLVECLEVEIPPEMLKLNAAHIRKAMLKSEAAIKRLVEYQICHKKPIEDLSIINLITATPNKDFFEYASLFPGFSFYMTENVLEQISENIEDGMKWLTKKYTREIGEFVSRYASFFNEMLERNRSVQSLFADLYEKMLSERLGHTARYSQKHRSVAVVLAGTSGADETETGNLVLYDDKASISDSFFRIFAMQLLHSKLVSGADISPFLLKKRYVHPGYTHYVKAKHIAGIDVRTDVEFLRKNLVDVSDLVGYLTICGISGLKTEKDRGILANFGDIDSETFVSLFPSSSEFERFVMLFGLKKLTKEAENLIKEEIIASLHTKNRLYFKMLVLQLFKCSEKDGVLRILEKSYEDRDLLLKLNLHNIASGGRYCSKVLISQGDQETVKKALYLLYYLKIWDPEYVSEVVNRMSEEGPEEWRSLVADVKGIK